MVKRDWNGPRLEDDAGSVKACQVGYDFDAFHSLQVWQEPSELANEQIVWSRRDICVWIIWLVAIGPV